MAMNLQVATSIFLSKTEIGAADSIREIYDNSVKSTNVCVHTKTVIHGFMQKEKPDINSLVQPANHSIIQQLKPITHRISQRIQSTSNKSINLFR